MDQEKRMKDISKKVCPLLEKAAHILSAEIQLKEVTPKDLVSLIHIYDLIAEAEDQLKETSHV